MILPGPWWNCLTYIVPDDMELPRPGARVRVPAGGGSRVGIAAGPGEAYDGELRPIVEAIDDAPLFGPSLVPLLRWFSDTYLCAPGTALRVLMPKAFRDGLPPDFGKDAALPHPPPPPPPPAEPISICEPDDAARRARYLELASDGLPTLICCPSQPDASALFDSLIDGGLDPSSVMLVPKGGPAAVWRAWCRASAGIPRVAVGSQMSACLPLAGLARVIVEDESSSVWRTARSPIFNVRSLLAVRARMDGASLVLGGRMPSARAFMRLARGEDAPPAPRGKRIFWVDSRDAYRPGIKDIAGTLPISEPLVRETERAIREGGWSLWILDRKGYAGEIVCAECASPLRCPKCGGAMRWEASRHAVACAVCGTSDRVPEVCPNCGGRLLEARRPGIEAAVPLAELALPDDIPITAAGSEEQELDPSAPPGLVIGTRAVLELLDRAKVGLVAWLDVDGEARGSEYDARARAFGLVWESMWRGRAPHERSLLIQSRRPALGWMRGLERPRDGWRLFWRSELEERRRYSMPPFVSLIRIGADAKTASEIYAALAERGFEAWDADAGDPSAPRLAREAIRKKDAPKAAGRVIWIRTKRMRELKELLAPWFQIKRARQGYPEIAVWHD